jgi:hypothetical protein
MRRLIRRALRWWRWLNIVELYLALELTTQFCGGATRATDPLADLGSHFG